MHQRDGKPQDALASTVDLLVPPELISTTECAIKHRVMPGPDGKPVKWLIDRTPYMRGIQDASDIPFVRVVAVKGPARSGKTVGAENRALKHWIYGPSVNVLWYMQSREDVEDYVEERVEWMLEAHEQVNAKVNWTARRASRNRKRIGGTLARWLAATKGTTRGKAAPLIVADEIDAYPKAVRKSILTRLINRQREFGAGALAYICSHPDEGPDSGIDAVLRDCLEHFWYWDCLDCGRPSSPNPGAEYRMQWNVPELLGLYGDLGRKELLERVAVEAALICPHCQHKVADAERGIMNQTGRWLQTHQTFAEDWSVVGEPQVAEYMGFSIHGFMSPFIETGKLAAEWISGKLEADLTGDETALKEVVVKSMGETFIGADAAKQIEDWKVVERRLKEEPYLLGTVPWDQGARFLTAFVDPQVDRFEVRVIAWSPNRESWLVDAFAIKQPPADPVTGKTAFENLSPFTRIHDWKVLEDAVLRQTYPLAGAEHKHLPIARMVVDTGGGDETTVNARKWAAGIHSRKKDPVPMWRVLLTKGGASKKGELYGKPVKREYDDQGKPLASAVWERVPNVHDLKGIIALRMKIEVPGPGKMHFPTNLQARYARELCAEQLTNGDWLKSQYRFNETWDGWVACEVARESLQPEREVNGKPINWEAAPPIWAKPFEIGKERGIDANSRRRPSYYDRLRKLNKRAAAGE